MILTQNPETGYWDQFGAKFIVMGYSDNEINDMHYDYQQLRRRAWARWGR